MTYMLKSNIKGTVNFLGFWSTNQRVIKGDLMFSIIPSGNSNYIVNLRVKPLNMGKIKKGQQVNINLQSYPQEEFGYLVGNVNRIYLSPDKDGLYLIDASLSENLITSYNKKIEFKQEMVGNAEIITEDLRLIERFVYQLREGF